MKSRLSSFLEWVGDGDASLRISSVRSLDRARTTQANAPRYTLLDRGANYRREVLLKQIWWSHLEEYGWVSVLYDLDAF